MLTKDIPCTPEVLLLNNSSSLGLNILEKRVWLAGLTAAKRIIACRWKTPQFVTMQKWVNDFLDIAKLEQWASRMHNAKPQNVQYWDNIFSDVNLIRLVT